MDAGELQLHPEYRVKRGIEAVLRKVPAGFDDFVTEKYQDQIEAVLREWSVQLLGSPQRMNAIQRVLLPSFAGSSLHPERERTVHETSWLKVSKVDYAQGSDLGADAFLAELRSYLSALPKLLTAEFQIVGIHSDRSSPSSDTVLLAIVVRYEFVGEGQGYHREQRIGHWEQNWELLPSGDMRLQTWRALDEERSRASVPAFVDISSAAFGSNSSYAAQLIPGTDYWRTLLDGASGIDIYGHNGVSVGDIDGDGLDDLYICQPAGLPNRLFRNRGEGTFEDITDSAGAGVLENTACALFADIDNDGKQDLIVVRTNGPLLFLNQGNGKFQLKRGAFQFANPPQGTFTGAAIADYDRDGWLDIYFCLYAYYQGADQYRYPIPYFDAENGPPNFLMRNNRDNTFRDVTQQSGLNKNNTRFSFCCAWADSNGDNWPDLYVVNDFGRKNLYKNNGDGTFTDVAKDAGVEDVGAGMSGAWADFDNDGREDLYVADMWTSAGLRVSDQQAFQKDRGPSRALYRKHAMGNSLFFNKGERFTDAGVSSGTAVGRWAWSSDAWDFDHDGFADIYITNGMYSGLVREDLNSFFWRQVVANSPNEPRPSHEYEQAWNVINELIRADRSWSGFERNVFYLNNRDRTFSDVSGVLGLDFVEDGRTFALGDFDGDGRLEVILKNRNGPQLRYLKNALPDLPGSISFRLTGRKSNRDAVGAKVTIETKAGRQTRTVGCGSGFLAQHTKELYFGLGEGKLPTVQVTIVWPSGVTQKLQDMPVNHRIWVEEGIAPNRMETFNAFKYPAVTPHLSSTEILPQQVETWLLVPVVAPEFLLSSDIGRRESLSSRKGQTVLLHFYADSLPDSGTYLEGLSQAYEGWLEKGFELLAIDVDGARSNSNGGTPSPGPQGSYAFRVLKASEDVIAVYNLLFRQLFDRHRDMSVPLSFLIDRGGSIVKVYQGPVAAERIYADFQSIPRNDAERLTKALPFAGLRETYEYGRNYLSLGFVFYERGYYEQAEQFYDRALKDDPGSAEALYGLGSAYLQQQKTSQARECFQKSVELRASYPGTLPNSWNNLGILAAREGNYDQAIEYFERALKIDPEHSIALQNLGSAYRQKKDWAQAKSALERALALNPDEPEANYSLGMVYAQQDDVTRAQEYLQKAIALRPAYPEALNNLGILHLRARKPEQAIQSFEQCIRVAPAYDQAYLNLARVYALQGEREKAKAVLQVLLQQHPEHVQAKQALAELEK